MNDVASDYLYFRPDLRSAGLFADVTFARITERTHAVLDIPHVEPVDDPSGEISRSKSAGVVFEMAAGLPEDRHLRLVEWTLGAGKPVWMFWPAEQAIERVDEERLRSLRRHVKALKWMNRLGRPFDDAITRWHRVPPGLRWIYRGQFPVRRIELSTRLDRLRMEAQPVPIDRCDAAAGLASRNGAARFNGVGVYIRADYWMPSSSDDRASRMVTELGAVTERVVCLLPRHDPSLDQAAVQQVVMDQPRQTAGQDAIVLAPAHYSPIVKATCQALRPTYLYERLCAGGSVGAELSQTLRIPYIVEYHGAEKLMHEALNGNAPFYAELYAKAEELSLRQATVILVDSPKTKDHLIANGIDASRVMVEPGNGGAGARLAAFMDAQAASLAPVSSIPTGDVYKDRVQKQWNSNPVGSHYARQSQPHTLEWFLEVERHRYKAYAPWMPQTMEFERHAGKEVLEIGGGMGTDLAQFAAHGSLVTDLDLSAGHLQLAEENFRLRGLKGRFVHQDAEALPFDDQSFDLVYSNGVLHHTPDTAAVIREIHRVLRRGGRVIAMVYAENSLHYWRNLFWTIGVKQGLLAEVSMGEIMSRSVERSANDARPLVKVYTHARLRALFKDFSRIEIFQRQLLAEELPRVVKWAAPLAGRVFGWNLIVKAVKA